MIPTRYADEPLTDERQSKIAEAFNALHEECSWIVKEIDDPDDGETLPDREFWLALTLTEQMPNLEHAIEKLRSTFAELWPTGV